MTTVQLKVLLVEDNPVDADILQEVLEETNTNNFEIVHVELLKQALEKLGQEDFSAILLDLSLPDVNGVETVTRVHQAFPQIPIVVLTGFDDEEIALSAVREGAQDYLVKGELNGNLLLRALRYAIERGEMVRRLRESEERYAIAVRGANDGLWDWELLTNQTYFSPRFAAMLGLGEGDLGKDPENWFNRIHPQDIQQLKTAIKLHLQKKTTHLAHEHRILHRDGSYRWVLCRGQALWTKDRAYRLAGSQTDITERKQAEYDKMELIASLRESEERFRAMADTAPVMIWLANKEGLCTFFNQSWLDFTGRSLDEEKGFGWLEEVHEGDRGKCISTYESAILLRESFRLEYRMRRADGQYRWLINTGTPRFTPDGNFVGYIGSCLDITERKQLEQEVFQEKELAQVTLRSIGDAVITTDAQGRIQSLNPAAEKLISWPAKEANGKLITEVCSLLDEQTRQPLPNPAVKAIEEGSTINFESHALLISRYGKEYAIDDSAAPIRARDGQIIGAVVILIDITEERDVARRISWQASHDALTGLVNRREFNHRLEGALKAAHQENQQHALCYLDLDRFKIVNDSCGHAAGDELLRQITSLLQTKVRKTDTLARLGGDEFGVLLYQCPLQKALEIANNLREVIQEFRFSWQDNFFAIGVSIGLVRMDGQTESLDSILSAADAACYAAKNQGRNRVCVAPTIEEQRESHYADMQWFSRLQKGLEDDRFCIYYQAIAPLMDNCASEQHYELLLRLVEGEDVSLPMAFIPTAERHNLMPKIDRWVIKEALQHLGHHKAFIADINCSLVSSERINSPIHEQLQPRVVYTINISADTLSDSSFIDFFDKQLRLHNVPPCSICLELNETVAIMNINKTIQLINKFAPLGCRFSLDNFGSGMSSFNHLKNLPVNYLKIDGNLIQNIHQPVDIAIIQAINQVGKTIGAEIIAKSVENEKILEQVKGLGISYGQGYAISKPRPCLS